MAETKKPNIIWIMADDLSWGDLGCYGQELIATPNIDRLAAEGVRFTSCYSGSTVCAPSRSCLMQGLHSGHTSVRENFVQFEPGLFYRPSLTSEDVTVAQVLSNAGYATGLFGKWGLSLQDQPGAPNDKGFDEFLGYLNQRHAHSYYPPFLWHNRERIDLPENTGYKHLQPSEYDENGRIIPNGVADPKAARHAFELYAERSLDFVRAHHNEPFFLYLAYTMPHGVQAIPELGEYKDRPWPLKHKIHAAMVSRMDSAVGELMSLLQELEIDDNTLVFFVSDNGYSLVNAAKNPTFDEVFDHSGPWNGGKGRLNQGGVRVPAIARWPGRIPAGVVSEQVWAFWDFLPTAAEVAGAEIPSKCDGVSILPALLGESQRQHEYLYWEFNAGQAARIGRWWVHREHPDKPVQVFDADNDPQETRDLAAEMPDIVRQAETIFREAHIPNPQNPSPGEPLEQWLARSKRAGVVLEENVDR
ncbi:MAG: arylsulfatase [Armatimonadota bacterium]|nr:arylsulfatase [Armatimonadota bacterium]